MLVEINVIFMIIALNFVFMNGSMSFDLKTIGNKSWDTCVKYPDMHADTACQRNINKNCF